MIIDYEKAALLIQRLAAQLRYQPVEYHDPLYGDIPQHRWYPCGLLVNAEDVMDCVRELDKSERI